MVTQASAIVESGMGNWCAEQNTIEPCLGNPPLWRIIWNYLIISEVEGSVPKEYFLKNECCRDENSIIACQSSSSPLKTGRGKRWLSHQFFKGSLTACQQSR